MSRRGTDPGDVAEAWAEVARLRRLALVAAREAAERRRIVGAWRADALHPRAQGLAAAADFHETRAARAAERADVARRLAEALERRPEAARGVARCA